MRRRDYLRQMRCNHIAMWTWLSITGGRKQDWPEWMENGGSIEDGLDGNYCFACTVSKVCNKGVSDCPVEWSTGIGSCNSQLSEYGLWLAADNIEVRKRLAARISTLWPPVK